MRVATTLILACAMVSAVTVGGAWAQQGVLINTPVYNPETKSYFELARNVKDPKYPEWRQTYQWPVAKVMASKREFKGVKGRLAVVQSKQTNDFLRETFKPDGPAWIGLRYWCFYHKLEWVTGEVIEPGDYQNWENPWNVTGVSKTAGARWTCSDIDKAAFAPVNYWNVTEGFRWNGNGQRKTLSDFLVEYPTGGE